MCLSDLGTAVLIGGEGVNQQSCRDALWKLEIGGDFRVVKSHGVLEGRWEGIICAYGGYSKGITSGMSPG